MNLAKLLNDKKCVPQILENGKCRLDFFIIRNERTRPCVDFPGYKIYIGTDPVNKHMKWAYIIDWEGQRAYCHDDFIWLNAGPSDLPITCNDPWVAHIDTLLQ